MIMLLLVEWRTNAEHYSTWLISLLMIFAAENELALENNLRLLIALHISLAQVQMGMNVTIRIE